jgi:hypothetical protein
MAGIEKLLKFLKKSEEYGSGAAADIAKIFAKASKGGAGAADSAKLSRTSAKLIQDIKDGNIPDPAMFGPPKPGALTKAYDKIMGNPKTSAAAALGAAGAGGGAYAMMGDDDDRPKRRRRPYAD